MKKNPAGFTFIFSWTTMALNIFGPRGHCECFNTSHSLPCILVIYLLTKISHPFSWSQGWALTYLLQAVEPSNTHTPVAGNGYLLRYAHTPFIIFQSSFNLVVVDFRFGKYFSLKLGSNLTSQYGRLSRRWVKKEQLLQNSTYTFSMKKYRTHVISWKHTHWLFGNWRQGTVAWQLIWLPFFQVSHARLDILHNNVSLLCSLTQWEK